MAGASGLRLHLASHFRLGLLLFITSASVIQYLRHR